MFKTFVQKFKYDFWGTVFAVSGAILIAANIGYNKLGYFLFLLSSVLYTVFSVKEKNRNMLVMYIVFSIINTLGLIRY